MAPAYPDKHLAETRAYRKRNPDRVKAMIAAYRKRRPEVRLAIHQRRRAREASADGHFTGEEWLALVALYGGRCAYGGEKAPLQADHRTPLSRGGSNFISNILPACKSCNCRKAKMTEREFRVRLLNERLRSTEFEVVDWWAASEIQSVS